MVRPRAAREERWYSSSSRRKKHPENKKNSRTVSGVRRSSFLMGGRVEDIAKDLRVNRTTVWRWRRDPKFHAYLHDLRWDRNKAWRNKVDHLIELAAREVEKAILAGDLKTAMEVFKRIPQHIPEAPSSLSPGLSA